jgi:hypothetical protein
VNKVRTDQSNMAGDPNRVGRDHHLTIEEQRARDKHIENNPAAHIAGKIIKESPVGLGPRQEEQIKAETGKTVSEILQKTTP